MIIKEKRYVRKYSAKNVKDKSEIILAWDTETDGLNGALQCITYDDAINPQLLSGPFMVEDFCNVLLQHPYPAVWYAHNAQYDWRYILRHLIAQNYHIEFLNRTDSDIFQVTIWHSKPTGDKKNDKLIPRTVMRDSMAIFPGTLADLVKYYAPGHKKLDIDLEHIRFDVNNATHQWYAINDAIILRHAMNGLNQTFSNIFGCQPALTTAGSSLKAWQNTLGDEEEYFSLSTAQEEFIDNAYYGGLVFLTDTKAYENCKTYDINSSYPSQMLYHDLPYGRVFEVTEIMPGKLGFYRVQVQAPDNLIVPILPSRDDKGNMQWRGGTFESTVSSIELQFALEHDYILLDVIEGVIFDDAVKPFDRFIGACKSLRKKYKGTAVEELAKLMQNSLYGKFGARRVRQQVYIPLEEADLEHGQCVDGDLGIWCREVMDLQMPRMPAWAAWITAQARLDLLRAIYSVGVQHVLYGDTDSITVKATANTDRLPQHESEYGYYKHEKTWDVFQAIAPKVYVGKINGKITGKVKGIPRKYLTAQYLQTILESGNAPVVHYESVPKLTAILKGKAEAGNGTQGRKRGLSDLRKSQNWQESQDHTVRPRVAAPRLAS